MVVVARMDIFKLFSVNIINSPDTDHHNMVLNILLTSGPD